MKGAGNRWNIISEVRRRSKDGDRILKLYSGKDWVWELSRKISTAICRFAEEQGCDTIVFEHLDIKGKIRGSRKEKLHLWRKRDIQKRCEHMAHRKGIHCSHVNA